MPIFSNIVLSNQLFYLINTKYPEFIKYNTKKNYFEKISENGFNLNRYNNFLEFIISHNKIKTRFQRFLNEKSDKFCFNKINLEDIKSTCCTKEIEIYLLLSIIYYFST